MLSEKPPEKKVSPVNIPQQLFGFQRVPEDYDFTLEFTVTNGVLQI